MERIDVRNGVGETELLRLAASLDQLSVHTLARALVADATSRGLELSVPRDVHEQGGQGIAGQVGERAVAVGSRGFMLERGLTAEDFDGAGRSGEAGRARVLVAVDGRPAGVIVMADRLRDDAAELVSRLHAAGVGYVALVSGDHGATAEAVGRQAGVDRVYADMSPQAKLEVVEALRNGRDSRPVVMVGDGINDAPALALADVGIAVGGAGATVAAQTADAVIVVDRIDRVADAVRIGRRSMAIARQSVVVGLGLSIVGMAVAAAGYLPPVGGAIAQEGIDVAVILNALRALRDG